MTRVPGLRVQRPAGARPQVVIRQLTVTGAGVRVGDVVTVGGIPHRVRDMREVYPGRRWLGFDDGNAYVLGVSRTIEVTRAFVAAPGPVPGVRRLRPVPPTTVGLPRTGQRSS